LSNWKAKIVIVSSKRSKNYAIPAKAGTLHKIADSCLHRNDVYKEG